MRKKWNRLNQGNERTPAHLKAIVPVKQNSTGGRPTFYDRTRHPQMVYLVISNFGATLEQLAPILGVNYATIKLWSFTHKAFRDAIKHGRWEWSMDSVEASLTKRAIGYEVIETTTEEVFVDVPIDLIEDAGGTYSETGNEGKGKGKGKNCCDTNNAPTRKIKLPGTKVTHKTKHVPASTSAILFFLQNRAPEDWKHVRHIEQNVNFSNTPVPDFVGNVIEVNPRDKVAKILEGLSEHKLEAMRKLHEELADVTTQMKEETAPVEATDMEEIFNEVVTSVEEEL